MKGVILAAWAASLGLITWKTMSTQGRPPLPSEVLATFVVFGTLTVLEPVAPQAAGYMAWGLDIAGAINVIPGIANLNTPGAAKQTGQQQQATAAASPAGQGATSIARAGGIK